MTTFATILTHLGRLHAYETLLLMLVAFGPFVIVAGVVFLLRRRDVSARRPARPDRPSAPSSSRR